jgi:hypothetical protein
MKGEGMSPGPVNKDTLVEISDAIVHVANKFRRRSVSHHELLEGIVLALVTIIKTRSQNPSASAEACIEAIRRLMVALPEVRK